MDLILIACCNEKTAGGSTEYQISKLEEYVSSQALNKLLVSRKTLAEIKKLLLGPNFGTSTNQTKILYKSAYSRYYGIVYKRSNKKSFSLYKMPQEHYKIIKAYCYYCHYYCGYSKDTSRVSTANYINSSARKRNPIIHPLGFFQPIVGRKGRPE